MPSRADVDKLLARFKLEPYMKLIKSGLIPAMRIAATKRIPRSQVEAVSKFGGEPFLAWDDPWPSRNGQPLHFLAQVRLGDLPRGWLPRGLLPHRGWLRFWFDSIAVRGEGRADPDLLRVTFDPDDRRTLERRPWPRVAIKLKRDHGGDPWQPFPEAVLKFEPILSIDHRVLSQAFAEAWEREKGDDQLLEFTRALGGGGRDGNHQLLGDVVELQSDMRAACVEFARQHSGTRRESTRQDAVGSDKEQWRLLARLDSQSAILDWCWGDAGSLNWFIREEDLKRCAFDRACGIWDNGG